jgi:D-glycero-D-manno-heptose 1,7-bisphosphate phosphatase
VEALEIIPGVKDALEQLKSAGFALIVVTNQPDVARGTQRRETVEAINAALAGRLPIDEVRVCYHDDQDGCDCRKPAPGLLTRPPVYDVAGSVMVGDRWRDIDAGKRAGVRATVLIASGYIERCPTEPDLRVESLADALPFILSLRRTTT